MFEKQSNRCDCFSLILVLILTSGEDLLHQLIKALLIFLPCTSQIRNLRCVNTKDQWTNAKHLRPN